MNKENKELSMREALKICEEALNKHKGGRKVYLQILEILEEYSEEHEDDGDEIRINVL